MKTFLSALLFLLTMSAFGQTLNIVGPVQYGDNIPSSSTNPGDIVYRTAQYRVTGGNLTDATLKFYHSSVTNSPDGHAFQSLSLHIGFEDFLQHMNTYDIMNAVLPISMVPGMGLTSVGSVLSPDPNNFSLAASFLPNPNPITITGVTVPMGEYIYIIECFKLNPEYCGQQTLQLGSTLNIEITAPGGVSFSGPALSPAGTIGLVNNQIPLWVISSGSTSQFGPLPENVHETTDNGNTDCTSPIGSSAARKLRFELTGTSAVDPYFRLELNQDSPNIPTLFEVKPEDIYLKFHYVLDNEIIDGECFLNELANLGTYGNTIAQLSRPKNDPSGNAIFSSIVGPPNNTTIDDAAGSLITPNTWNDWWSSNSIAYLPSLADASTPIVESIHLHLSNLNISPTGTTNTGNQIVSNFTNLNFLTLLEGSYVEVHYKGTFVPQDNIHVQFEQMRCVPPVVSTQYGFMNCFDPCDLKQVQIDPNSANNTENHGAASNQLQLDSNTPYSAYGDPFINGNVIWDGELEMIQIGILGSGDFSHNKPYEVLHYDMSCSEIEFVLELSPGLSIPYPNLVDPNSISFPGSCTNTYAGTTMNPYGTSQQFYIENGGVQYAASNISIQLIDQGGDCCGGQTWKIRMPLGQFYGTTDPIPSSYGNVNILNGGTLNFVVQTCCPTQEPTADITVKTYFIPGYCANQSFVTPTSPPPSTFNGVQYLDIDCNSSCLTSSCPDDRIMMSINKTNVSVLCPGCSTPGSIVAPGIIEMQRHNDFRGYKDEDDNGIADLPRVPADQNDIQRNLVRHGDVVSANVAVNFYNGDPFAFNPDPMIADEYTVDDLSTASSFAGCDGIGTLPDVVLSTHVLDIELINSNFPAATFTNMFCPLVKNAPQLGNTLEYNNDIFINHGYDNVAGNNYLDLADNYVSKINFMYSDGTLSGSGSMIIQDQDVVWYDDKKYRIAIDVADVNAAFINAGTPVSITAFNAFLTMEYELYFVTDVDIHVGEWPIVVRGSGCSMTFDYKAYATGVSDIFMLGGSGIIPDELDKSEPSDFCAIENAQEWWCERGIGSIKIAPYHEDRWILNNFISESPTDAIHAIEDFITADDDLSPCAELGPLSVYEAGGATGLNPITWQYTASPSDVYNYDTYYSYNHFDNEIRHPALPEVIDLYLPYPFEAEAIVLFNRSGLSPTRYNGGAGSQTTAAYVLPLVGDNAINLATYGITVSTVTVDPDFIPRFPDMGLSNYNNGTSQIINGVVANQQDIPNQLLGGPIFDPSATKQHTKVSIPINMFYDPAAFSSGVFHAPNLPSGASAELGGTAGFPLFVADEYLTIYAGLMYSGRTCPTPPNPDPMVDPEYNTPYDLGANGEFACEYYSENQDILYFDGDPNHLLSLFLGYGVQNLQPVDIAPLPTNLTPAHFGWTQIGSIDPAEGTAFHPDYNTSMNIPNCIQTAEPFHPSGGSSITSKVEGVTRHPLDYSHFSFDVATQNLLKSNYSGAVPSYTQRPLAPQLPAPEFPIGFYDQRSKLTIQNVGPTNLNVNSSSEFQLTFQLKDEVLDLLHNFAAPCEFLNENLTDNTYTNFINNPVFNQSEKTFHNNRSQLFKRHIDIDNLYFYLVPKSGPLLNFYEDIKITEVSGVFNSLDGVSFSNSYGAGVPAAKADLSPIIFQLGDVEMATVISGMTVNKTSDEITITAKFDCSRPELKALVNQDGASLTFPFDLVINYNCDGDLHAWNGTNAPDFSASNFNLNVPTNLTHAEELTYGYAHANRCANDLVFTEYKINPKQFTYDVTVDDATVDPCSPQFTIEVENTNDGDLYLHEIHIPTIAGLNPPLLNGISAAVGSTWIYQLVNPSALTPGATQLYTVTFGGPVCTQGSFVLDANVYATSNCFSCAPYDVNCYYHELGSGTFNYGVGVPGNPLTNFDGISVFPSSGCLSPVSASTVNVTMDIPASSGIPVDYTLFLTVTDGNGVSCSQSIAWNSGTALGNFNLTFPNSPSCNIDLSGCSATITLDAVETDLNCGGSPCIVEVLETPQSCSVEFYPQPQLDDPADITLCEGQTFTFPTITGTNLTNNTAYFSGMGGSGTSYQTNDQLIISSSTSFYAYDQAGPFGCSDEESFTVTIIPTPQIDPIADLAGCDMVTLPAISGINIGSPSYWTGTNGTGTQYFAGDDLTAIGTTTLYAYGQTGTSPNCWDEEIVTIAVYDDPTINNPGSQQFCEGETYVLPALGGVNLVEGYYTAPGGPNGIGIEISALTGISTSQTIYIYAGNGPCVGEESFNVFFQPSVQIIHEPMPGCGEYTLVDGTVVHQSGIYTTTTGLPLCEEHVEGVTILPVTQVGILDIDNDCTHSCTGFASFSVNGNLPFTYTLTSSGSPTSITVPISLTTLVFNNLCADDYTLIVTGDSGCETTVSFTIEAPPSPLSTSAVLEHICNGGSGGIDLTATGGFTPSYNYFWSNGATTEDLTVTSAGIYSVTVTNDECEYTESYTIQDISPNTNFTFDVVNCVYQFTNQSTLVNGSAMTVEWDFGDGSPIENNWDVQHVFTTSGSHTVCLTLSATVDGVTCVDEYCMVVDECIIDCTTPGLITPSFSINSSGNNFTFTNTSSALGGSLVSVVWTINGGSPIIGSQLNVQLTGPQNHDVCMTVTYIIGGEICSLNICEVVMVGDPCETPGLFNIDWDVLEIGNGQYEIVNNSTSVGTIISTTWDFGPGVGSFPNVQFPFPGDYPICMTMIVEINGQQCSITSCKDITVMECVSGQSCGFTVDITGYQLPMLYHQFNTVINPNQPQSVQYDWYFGVPFGYDSGPSPIFQYPAPGIYNVTLIVTIDLGDGICVICEQQKIKIKKKVFSPGGNNGPGLIVSPNPSTGMFSIEGDLDRSQEVTIMVMNELGKVIKTLTYSDREEIIVDLTTEENGVYFIELINGAKVYYEKVILMK